MANGSIQGLDQQVQEIKTDVLSIANELRQLEEKLLYPSDTQLAVFFSVADAGDVEIDSLDVEIDGEAVAHHVYSFKELEALKKGGVQRLYTGNVRPGEHEIRVALSGQRAGSSFERTHLAVFTKLRPPKIVEFELLGSELGARRIAADGS